MAVGGEVIIPPASTGETASRMKLAEQYACPLLYVGDDFAKTDIASALEQT